MQEKNELFNLLFLMTLYIPRSKLSINFDFNIYTKSNLMINYINSLQKKLINIDKEQALYTKSILYELISTEFINDYGLITNLDFNYFTNINLDNKTKNNPIQKAIFKKVEEIEKKDRKSNYKLLFNEDEDNLYIKLVWKKKNLIMENIEEKFDQDDYLQLNKLQSSFNTSLINSFYNYSNKIIMSRK